MTGRTHAALGLTIGLLAAAHTPGEPLLRTAVVCMAIGAALLPDIDHPKAIVSGYLPGVGHAARLVVSHRGATHTGAFAAAIMALLFVVGAPASIVIAAMGGIISHLIADMATPAGIPLLMPVTHRTFRVAPRSVLWATSWILEAVALVGSLVLIGLVLWGKL